jgi:uncharacterized membrane-anchored protein YjiN (DUF445 family)
MKAAAAALLAVALAVFVGTYLVGGTSQWVQFVRAGSEAAMVGGLADWFAVTALFRRPLGLPIPHTALIPSRKDALAADLGEFMTTFFLDPQVVADHLARVDLVGRVGEWLADPDHARTVSRESAAALAAFIETAGPEPIVTAALGAVRIDMGRRSYAAQAGEFLSITTAERAHVPILNLLLRSSADWLRREEDHLVEPTKALIESSGFLAWLYITDRKTKRAIRNVAEVLDQMLDSPNHPLRRNIDRLLAIVALDLRADTPLAHGIDAACVQVLSDERTRQWLNELVAETLVTLDEALTSSESDLVQSFANVVSNWGRRATVDDQFRQSINTCVERVLLRALEDHAEEFTRLVTDTVANWDARETADRIEIAVGRDLQFIRVNGTVVGALAGLSIHAFSLLLP